jgi:predicted permease
MDSLIKDIKFGVRSLLKRPGFTLIAVLSLSLGIGANTAIFSLLDSLMLKSLPVHEPDKLVLLGSARGQGLTTDFPDESWDLFSYPFYREVQKHNDIFSGVTSLSSIPWTVHGTVNANGSPGEIERLDVQLVAGTYFSVLGITPRVGRLLSDADDQNQGGHPVAVVSYEWWEKRFNGDPSAVGKSITIDEVAYTIVGVAPKEFFGTTVGQAPEIWIPLAMEKQLPPAHWDGRNKNDFQSLFVIGRLKDGVSMQQANAAVNLLFKQSLQERAGAQPTTEILQKIQRASVDLSAVGKGLSLLRDQFSLSLKILMAAVALVLLIACANVANLLLAHGAARRREFAVRLAVGATRTRLMRQLFTESVLLAMLGGFVGVALAWWGSQLLVLMASNGPEAVPLNVTPNIRILGFTLGASLLSSIVFGVAPALRASRVEPNTSLKSGKGTATTSLQNPLGKALVVTQVALSLVLLVGAGLFVRTLINLESLPSGFNEENVMLFQIDSSAPGYKREDPRLSQLLTDVETRARAVPGVQSAAFSFLVFNQGFWTSPVFTLDQNSLEERARVVRHNVVGQDFFDAMGIRLVLGRGFGPQDGLKTQKVAVISESMAQRFFPNTSPLGKRFGIDEPKSARDIEIVGVVKDAKYGELTEQFRPMAYYPFTQRPGPLNNFVVRFNGAPGTVVPSLRQAIKQVNRNLPIDDVVSLSDHIGRSLVQPRLVARVASFFGLLALLLACIGLYGVMSYAVARRTNEIGIRMALGAQSRGVLWLVLREVLILIGIGIAIGLLSAFAATRTASSLLFGLKPNDPLTIAAASSLLLVVALFAGYLPARRAARVDPMVALRDE